MIYMSNKCAIRVATDHYDSHVKLCMWTKEQAPCDYMHDVCLTTMQDNTKQPTVSTHCTAPAHHESFFQLLGWWGVLCTVLQMWPTLAGRRSGVKVVNCGHGSQGDQIGHLNSAVHHSHKTFFGGPPWQGTASKEKEWKYSSPWLKHT